MIKMSDFQEMVNIIDRSSVNVFTFEYEGMKMKLEKQPVLQNKIQKEEVSVSVPDQLLSNEQTDKAAKDEAVSKDEVITSPMVGTFYTRANESEEPLVQVGDTVQKGQVVCIVEAMKLFNEVQAGVDGEIVEVLVEDGDVVEYGQPLFKLKKRS
ncbi:acetyl-CoA carboxylase biotin carboxyl carrier protein [Domibacillus sp. DTU_2020_1001157_1_SI_ALB_TIR_016]|uniref:acetyl-CoA carboxylase biotin carboxyl carrier protein n=1 Tax=Domibacillus sp. DTU_2020_1001157_1_SI_ALB_TIR_016 TaxID=3077789 RepID=UPI0028E3507A|nr:acetyl-CoA carboxylase biotin carboxyl carrier protein [Domibacillus sp. DTU_2020_1001157_1_SI_ALB_TIR_016]WNS80218.1 acetyl-CoA carboxylase biotin carboxyl carrier protein [Domibacillus sp. DTU_2020_1001157_1_SI_ALB_TIR_016]